MKARTVSINTNIEHIELDEQEGIMSAAVEDARVCFLHWKFEEISSFIGSRLHLDLFPSFLQYFSGGLWIPDADIAPTILTGEICCMRIDMCTCISKYHEIEYKRMRLLQ